jgi:CBS domain-containing protein
MAQKVRDVMHAGVETVRPEDSVKRAASVMQAADIGPLPVCDGDRLVGIVTDRDITVRAVAAGRDPSSTPVRDVMTPDIVYVRADQDVDEAIDLMRQHEVRRLPVVEGGRLVGMVALADLARRTDEQRQAAALEGVSQVSETETDVP